jgi:hypothetical protein
MLTASSSTTSTKTRQRRSSASSQGANNAVSAQDQDFLSGPRPGIARHYTSLQEHADTIRHNSSMSRGSFSTPRAESRREGFAWEARQDTDSHAQLNPDTPPSMEEIMRATSKDWAIGSGAPTLTSEDSLPPQLSTESSFSSAVSRSDTNRSSISGIARGVMRHVPDMRMFLPMEKQPAGEEDVNMRKSRKHAGQRKSHGSQNSADMGLVEASKTEQPSSSKPTTVHKDTLKDRRKVALGQSMKLTLPTNIPELPSRGRTPVAELSNIAPPRSRSPKTPWVHDHPINWYVSSPVSAPATIFEDRNGELPVPLPVLLPGPDLSDKTGSRIRNRRSVPRVSPGGWKRSTTNANGSSPLPSPSREFAVTKHSDKPIELQHIEEAQRAHQAQTQKELKEIGKRCRPRRLLWNSSWGSSSAAQSVDTVSLNRTSFSLTRILKPKRSVQDINSPNNPSTSEQALRRRKKYVDMEKIGSMPVPPIFIPPGTSRIPTPPTPDANVEVKGKLADFVFNIEGQQNQRPPPTPGGIWDSDAILMSQTTKVTPPSQHSDESHQGPLVVEEQAPPITVTTPNALYFNVPFSTPEASPIPLTDAFGNEAWFRLPRDLPRRASAEAEERAKLEWLTTEHLPNSPLCPLHIKYVGPSTDVCVFHGRRRSPSDSRLQGGSGMDRRSGPLDGSGEEWGWGEERGFEISRRRKQMSSSGQSPWEW